MKREKFFEVVLERIESDRMCLCCGKRVRFAVDGPFLAVRLYPTKPQGSQAEEE